jgi:divalent metal cation (Fe/Co/Zn/Cd) transporter
MVQDGQRGTTTMADRAAEAQRATWVSVAVNLVMTIAQLVVGWLAHSQSLVAHGLHSFSDLLSDFLVTSARKSSTTPPTKRWAALPAKSPSPCTWTAR